ncbi:MAG: hypothetical protein ABSH24_35300 [Bryobacteraceae bacterium]|jgi:hypothetical protein
MVHHVKDLSADQRLAIESLLGRALREEESVTIGPSVVVQEAPTGRERERAFRQHQSCLDELAGRVKDVPEEKIDAAIEEAVGRLRPRGQ